MLLMVARQGIQQFSLPAGGKRRTEQALSGLQIVRSLDQGRHSGFAELPRPGEALKPDGIPLQMQLKRRRIVSANCRQGVQPLQILRFTFAAARGIQRHHPCAGQRHTRRDIAEHQPVVIRQPQRGIQHQLRQVVLEERHPAGNVAGSMVNMQRLPLAERRMALQLDNHPFRRLRRR